MTFHFDIHKAVAAAAYLCKLSGGSTTMLRLLKMLYVADRKALVAWQRPITGDQFVSMPHGPVLSRVYNILKKDAGWNVQRSDIDRWHEVFCEKIGTRIALKDPGAEVNVDPLSRREIEVLREAFKEWANVPTGTMIDKLHALPEWRDPGRSSVTIEPREILEAEHVGPGKIEKAQRDIHALNAIQVLLAGQRC